ncbi:MAG: aldo/keto reductase [Armatimonadota bacterium]|nr:aldo/keto reductase [bacterium]
MQYREFGNTGIKLSALGFGAMRLPKDDDEAVRIMQRSFEAGVNYLDTALVYGDSENKCGKALKGWREKIYLSTKNPGGADNSPDAWWGRLNQSLEKLDTDYIDFYQVVHGLTWDFYTRVLVGEGLMKTIQRAKDEGVIKHICFSTHDSPENIIKLLDTGEFEGLTLQYNLLDRKNEDVIAYAHEKGLGVIVMGPVGGGRLGAPSEQIRKMIPTEVKSSAEVALRFVLSNQNVTCAISGMSTMEQMEENTAVAYRDEALSLDEKQAIADALAENKRLAELYCTGCNYCMPCPNEVNIPENFKIMNMHRLYGLTDHAKHQYMNFGNQWFPEGKNASECIECGQCEPKCPQNIKIITQLKEVARTFGE